MECYSYFNLFDFGGVQHNIRLAIWQAPIPLKIKVLIWLGPCLRLFDPKKKKKKSVKSNNRLPKERKQKKAWYWSKRLAQPKIYQPTYCPTNCQGLLNSLNTQSIYHGMEQRQHLHFCDGKNQTLYVMEVPPPLSTVALEHTDEFLFVTSNCHIEISQYCPCWVKIDGI